jgi:hypothetical protein
MCWGMQNVAIYTFSTLVRPESPDTNPTRHLGRDHPQRSYQHWGQWSFTFLRTYGTLRVGSLLLLDMEVKILQGC